MAIAGKSPVLGDTSTQMVGIFRPTTYKWAYKLYNPYKKLPSAIRGEITLLVGAIFYPIYTLPETNSSHRKIGLRKRKLVFQPSIFRCELLVSGRVTGFWDHLVVIFIFGFHPHLKSEARSPSPCAARITSIAPPVAGEVR